MPSPSHARPPPPSPPPSGLGMLGGLKIAPSTLPRDPPPSFSASPAASCPPAPARGSTAAAGNERDEADAAQATSTGAPRCAFVKRRPGRTISTATRPTRLWLFPRTTTTSIMYRPGARGRPWTRPVKRMRFSPLTPATRLRPMTSHAPSAERTTRSTSPARVSRKLITVPRRAAGPCAEKRVLVTRTLRASAERRAASVRGALPVAAPGAGVADGAAPGCGVTGRGGTPRRSGGAGGSAGGGGAGGSSGGGGKGGGGSGGGGGKGGSGGGGGKGGGAVTVGSVKVGSRSPCAGPVRTTAAKSPAQPMNASKINRRMSYLPPSQRAGRAFRYGLSRGRGSSCRRESRAPSRSA